MELCLLAQARAVEVRVGIDAGDIRGSDNRALQAAVDQVAGLGGGVVRIGPGSYAMRNALTLRSNVHIIGDKAVLVACDGAKSRLALDGDCNERQITLEDPSGFRVGDGVAVRDSHYSHGFEVTTATLTAQVDARTFKISRPLYMDYMVSQKASAAVSFPVVGGWEVKNITIEGLTIDGNRDKAEKLDGCRGGGIFLFECQAVKIRNCVVRNYNGDGISFQVSEAVSVEGCLAENNAFLGLHPGSGSQRPILRNNRSIGNGGDGLYVCWRVKHGVFERNEIRGNKGAGISIGHKDTDNMFVENTIAENGKTGILFRDESEPMGAHRNVFEKNVVTDNGGTACVTIRGHHHDLVFRENTFKGASTAVGIWVGKHAKYVTSEGNRFVQVKAEVEQEP